MSNVIRVELQPKYKIQNTNHGVESITRIDAKTFSYNDFFWNYMNLNHPVIITSVSDKWLASKKWILNSKPNFKNLKQQIGDLKVPVANCSKNYFNSHEKSDMFFHGFLNYWQRKLSSDCEELLYLKDWHLKAVMPEYNFYEVPIYFSSDWLNEYLIDNCKDDYRFVYMGPEKSWTPFHADVFFSYSWSTNIMGRKKWIFIVPNDENKLKDSFGNFPFEINEASLLSNDVRFITVMQNENESLFVPSGWFHQVWNVTDTISVNHNWFNGCNVLCVWKNLSDNLEKVIKEIKDCKEMDDFEKHCQVMLKASFGMNYPEFVDLLEHIAMKRRQQMEGKPVELFNQFALSDFHILFDLNSINNAVKLMKTDKNLDQSLLNRCIDLENVTNVNLLNLTMYKKS